MNTLIKTAWTAAIVIMITLAWPLWFWGKSALPVQSGIERVQPYEFHNPLDPFERSQLLW